MAEETPQVRNKGMLLVALVLAALVVVIYNVQVARVRKAARGRTVLMLRFLRNMKAGEQLDAKKDLELVEMPMPEGFRFASYVVLNSPRERNSIDGTYVNRKINKGEPLMWAHISHEPESRQSENITRPNVAYPLEVATVPGELLSVGDKVNLVGRISLKGGPLKSYRLIEGVTVLAVGGQGVREAPLGGRRARLSDRALRSYRSITIEIPPDESLILHNVLSNVVGGVTVELLNPESRVGGRARRVNPLLRGLAAAPTGLGGRRLP